MGKKALGQVWFQRRHCFSHISLINELALEEPLDFLNYLRMDVCIFNKLLTNFGAPIISKKWTTMRDPIKSIVFALLNSSS